MSGTLRKRVFVVAAAGALFACSRGKTEPAPAVSTREVEGAGLCVDAPAERPGRTVQNDHGYVDYLLGEPGRDTCTVAIEVYLSDAPARPRTLEDLRYSLETDHEPSYAVTVAATTVQRDGRPTVTATLGQESGRKLRQRQWAFFLDSDPVVVTAYSTGELRACDALEASVLSSIRRAPCAQAGRR